ncbi:ABC transporter permease [Candidatus Nitrosacidococcus tergens]|uniref:Uncharacterized protein n=1 Tax=Candidatus Nitrosacidococcus tergens TaxID=553981 RepID=A0A7G1QB23_9GAMM|nr:MlaE family lipid ABC transporter permease subunit [Candidatus Nitrosacidococcus tergens]CAB1276968.1 conserved membrane protein of unknown function [Candidatus Nitrosacidococcus tergens]
MNFNKKASTNEARIQYHEATSTLSCFGDWTVHHLAQLERSLSSTLKEYGKVNTIEASGINQMDTGGAWLFNYLIAQFTQEKKNIPFQGLRQEHQKLLSLVQGKGDFDKQKSIVNPSLNIIAKIGYIAWDYTEEAFSFISFIGEVFVYFLKGVINPSRIRWRTLLNNMQTAGIESIPIIGLLVFLIGVVLAYQGGMQLQDYGANIFIVDLVSLTMIRELAPLIAAIIIAGRTGSAFAAQIGTMKVSEEIDALRILGIPPIEQLVIPKIMALMISLPLLTVFADICGIVGGMLMSDALLGVGIQLFTERLDEVVDLPSFFIGLFKAFFFAATIATVGCFQGFRVSGGAESVGRKTTSSVVQAIFLIIVSDSIFSIFFSWLGI